MSDKPSKKGDKSQSSQQSFQSQTFFEPPFEAIKTELHTIVDKLQLDEPSGEPPRRPLWQRVLIWQIPIWLVAFLIVLSYNPRVDSCGGLKINYKTQTLCIANDNDFFLFVEYFACDFIEKGAVAYDSLQMDFMASQTLQNYFTKYDFSLKKEPTEVEVLRGMRNARYDSTSFYKNVAMAFWNAGVRLLKEGKTNSACTYFRKLEQWKVADSILTAADREMITRNCSPDFPSSNQVMTPPKNEQKSKIPIQSKPNIITKQPTAPQINLKVPTVTPSVTFGKKPDLQQIEQANRQNTAPTSQKAPTGAEQQQKTNDPFEGQMVFVNGGTFMMGSNDKEAKDDEKPVHRVTLSNFSIGKYEVTQKQWREVMGTNPSFFKDCDNCPVEQVSWTDVQEFILKLNVLTKKSYRLPSEAEWEFAAQGGTRNNPKMGDFIYAGSNNIDEVAWYNLVSGGQTHPVGRKKENLLGLFDMSGNVFEWCDDSYNSYNNKNKVNNGDRVNRGGSWSTTARYCRIHDRDYDTPIHRASTLGFRIVLLR